MLNRPSFFIALIGIVAVTFLVARLRHGGPTPEPLVPPPQSPYAESIGARGIVESTNENVRVAPSASGLVEKVDVRVGGQVRAGDVLFSLDSRDAQAAVKTAGAQLAVQQARLAESQTLVDDRRDTLDRVTRLRQKNVASVDESKRDEFAMQTALRQFQRATADLDLARAQLDDARVGLDLLTVRAPRNGTILQVNIRAGEYAAANAPEPAVLLGDVRELQLRADVDESDAPRVKPGCKATAFLKGSREQAVPLEFVRIEPYILPKKSLSGESTERVDTRVLQVIFRFRNPGFPVYVGQQMDVFIEEN
ncbi:MAG: efflux RND transporter periplasmic adaptor subunit [Terrimicrobiaceae bacterium]